MRGWRHCPPADPRKRAGRAVALRSPEGLRPWGEYSEELAGDFCGGFGAADAGADGNGADAGVDELVDVVGIDSADGEMGEVGERFEELLEIAGAGGFSIFGGCGEHGTDADIVGLLLGGVPCFGEVVRLDADEEASGGDIAGMGEGEVGLAEVYAVGAGGEGDVETVVDDNCGMCFVG